MSSSPTSSAPAGECVDTAALTDEERARVLARYRGLRHRCTRVGFVTMGSEVSARNPIELQAATVAELIVLAAKQTAT